MLNTLIVKLKGNALAINKHSKLITMHIAQIGLPEKEHNIKVCMKVIKIILTIAILGYRVYFRVAWKVA